jgi:hypothetical protein
VPGKTDLPRLLEAIAHAGLPDRYEPLLLTFRLADVFQRGEYLIIGDDEGTDLCVQQSDGTVWPSGRRNWKGSWPRRAAAGRT